MIRKSSASAGRAWRRSDILQFPFYAGIAGIITATHLNDRLADAFVRVSTLATFPPLVVRYSAVLGVFVPSGARSGLSSRRT